MGQEQKLPNISLTLSETLHIIFLSGALTREHLREAEKCQPKACFEKDYSIEFIEKKSELIG